MVRRIKKIVIPLLILMMSINSFAAVVFGDDGTNFIKKEEFEKLKNDFDAQIENYLNSLDNKIDGAIADYINGIRVLEAEQVSINKAFAGKTFTMLNTDGLTIPEADRPKTIVDIKLGRVGGFTQTKNFTALFKWTTPGTAAGGRELCAKQAGSAVSLVGYYTDYISYYDMVGTTLGDEVPTAYVQEALIQFLPDNGSLTENSTSVSMNTTTGYTQVQKATGVFRGRYNRVEDFNYFAFNAFDFLAIPLNYGSAAPVAAENVTYSGSLLTTQQRGVWNVSPRNQAYDAGVQSSVTIPGFRIGRETLNTSSTVHPKYVGELQTSGYNAGLTLTAGINLISTYKLCNVEIKLDTNADSIRIAFSDQPFLSGWTTNGTLAPIEGKEYTNGYATLTKEELKKVVIECESDKTYYVKWNSVSESGNDTTLVIPETYEVV